MFGYISAMNKPLSVSLLLIVSFVLPSCKKGPEDPAISFRTRKARLVGEWRMKSGTASITLTKPNSTPFNQGFILDGSTATVNETEYNSSTPTVYKFAYLLSLTFKKDGKFELVENYGGKSLVASGTWNFEGRVGEAKNKDHVVMTIESVSGGSTDDHLFNKLNTEFTYKLIELRNKELKMETSGYPYVTAAGERATYESHFTFVQ